MRTGVAWGDRTARRSKLRAVLVAIDRLSLLVTHFGVAVERAPAALLPPSIEPEGHQGIVDRATQSDAWASVRECHQRRVATRSDDRHEDIDNVVAAVVLERRSCVVGIRPLREALRSRADLLVNSRRLAAQAYAGVPPTR